MRVGLALALSVLTALGAPAAAGAHIRSGKTAVDYRASLSTSPPGITARVYPADLALRLTVAAGHEAVVLGYLGEPAVRVGAAGVEVNRSSPTAAGTGLLKRASGRSPRSKWLPISSGRSVVWHDARLRGLPKGVTHGNWTVPLVVDGGRTKIGGELVRVPKPALWPWLSLGALAAIAVAFVLARRRTPLLRTATTVLGLVAAVATAVTAGDFAFASSAAEGAWVEGANELVFVLVGLAFVIRGSPDTRALAGGALGLLALAVGLSKLPALLHGIVLSALPAAASRASVALAICAGGAAVVLGVVVFFDVLEHYEEPASVERYL
jgi:hypothetical protein